MLNRFRGDPALLEPGPAQLGALTGVPLVAVIPMLRGHGLPEEDGWYGPATSSDASGLRTVAIVAPPRISNLDEFAPLAAVPGLRLVWARTPAALAGAEIVVLPGSKQVSGDLAWLRAQGLAEAIAAHASAGGAVLGVCGGLQMLGVRLDDPQGADGQPGSVDGLGLLPLATVYGHDKRVRPGRVAFGDTQGPWRALAGIAADGYEIRHGRTAPLPGVPCAVALRDAEGGAIGWQSGSVLGVYAHGLFESPEVVCALFGARAPTLESSFERLADCVEAAFAPGVLDALLAGR